jgi:3-methyladenine DNA glycosylase AlkD
MHPVERELKALANPVKKEFFPRFFKTGKGEYAEGDIFIGVTVPLVRTIVKKYKDLPLQEVEELLHNAIHECRLTALLILVTQFRKADEEAQKKIVNVYLKNTQYINNWDLVDASAAAILGAWLYGKDTSLLDKLAHAKSLWEQRIAIVSTLYFIRKKDLDPTLRIATILINHPHDLIHKATGWMLRCVGDVDRRTEEVFLKKYYKTMPRTMLRYAIEKFEEPKRKKYLNGTI